MKRFLAFTLLLLLTNITNAQPIVYMRSGNIANTTPEKTPQNDAAYFADNVFENRHFLWLQFSQFPTDEARASLEKTGVVLYNYLPDNTFISSFPIGYDYGKLNPFGVYGVCKPRAAYKIDGSLFTPEKISWAVNGDKLTVDVSFLNNVSKSYFINSLRNTGAQFESNDDKPGDIVTLEATISNIQKIASHPLVLYIEPTTHPAVIEDIQGISDHRLTTVQTTDNWTNGKKYDGKGVTIAIGDGQMAGTHIDFEGRLIHNSSASGTPSVWHSDHCTGIVGGAGNFNPNYRGQARGATLRVYDYYEPYNLYPSIYTVDSVRVVSHSLGQTCNSGYDANARSSDQIARSYPNLIYVHSAGNSGATSCGGLVGFKTITGGYKSGKNVLTVANLSKADVVDASSSRGPLPDGRIKPEIAAVGGSVNSTQPNNTYTSMTGTSMACPAVAGNMGVLMQVYKEKNNNIQPEAALLKAIALNTADDLGNPGPDFLYGYGRINMRKAVKAIEGNKFLSATITTGVTNNHTISIPASVSKAKIMVYWADKEGTAGASKSLVNNIDAKLVADNATEYLPWVLDIGSSPDETSCSNPAVTGTDSVNNMEQIEISNPAAGNYTLTVLGKKIPSGPQKYYVTYEFINTDEIVVTYPIGGETFASGESQRIRWDASDGISTFGVQYSLNNGTTWLTVASGVAADRRYVDWTVPSTATSAQALIKVSRGTASDVSDTNFVILKVPTNITFVDVCKNQTKVSWTAATGATSYDVFRLGEKYMELAGSTTTTNIVLDNQDNGVLFWYAVRARLASKNANGRLTNGISHTNTSAVVCPLAVKLISFDASLKNNAVNLVWKVASEENMINYIVEKSTSPNFENIETVGQIKPTNQLGEHTYQLFDYNLQTNTTFYYRLKMVESGKTLYSNVKSIKIDKWTNENFSLSPNPATNIVNISINKLNTGINNISIKIFNDLGVQVLNKSIKNATAANVYSLSTSTLPNGNYFVNVVDAVSNTILYKQQIVIIK